MARRIVLIGAGREAEAASAYFRATAPHIPRFVFDDNAEKAKAFAAAHGAAAFTADDGEDADIVYLRAPGMPPRHPFLTALGARGANVTTYLGYWLAHHRPAILATITGSKGKSTTTALCAAILDHAGLNVRAGGNIGIVPEGPPDETRWVFETSSYQLHDVPAAAPVHALTTLYPEHLDWHGGFANYLAAKLRPFEIDPTCVGVIPRKLAGHVAHLPNEFFLAEDLVKLEDNTVRLRLGAGKAMQELSPASTEALASNPLLAHNFMVALATAAKACRTAPSDIVTAADKALAAFTGLPSRQNLIGEFASRFWVDDALATIPQATMAALQRWPDRPVRLIMGGRNREQDFTAMIEYVNGRADVSVYAYGDSIPRFASQLKRAALVASLDEALNSAFSDSKPGEVILFSPAGATSEPGATYQDRARRFAEFARAQENAS
jgi:UDP-N-acetylmuramoylalanine--D-glutamate ligase